MNFDLATFATIMNLWGRENRPFLFIVDFELKQPIILTLEEAAKEGIFYTMDGISNFQSIHNQNKSLIFSKIPIEIDKYEMAFQKVMNEIRLGNSFLVNLTFPTRIFCNWSLTDIFERSNAPYRLLFKNQFVTFSPECFVRISDGKISAFPMKGTIDAKISEAAEIILNDSKEQAEHATIVDLIRNDLSMVSHDVQVSRYRYLEEIHTHSTTLLQVSSEITGTIDDPYADSLGDLICKMLPAGSISGAPKDSTLRIIREVEAYKRGYYTGVFGIFDGSVLNSAVMIRFIEKVGNQLFYKSGGGITSNSNLLKEYEELIDKVYVAAI